MTMSLSDELAWRGFVNQTTYKDIHAIDGEPITFYWGVDPSADSMQVGNLAAAMMVRHFIAHGHKAVLLVGGATGMVGDPDGKSEERELKTTEELERNKAKIVEQYQTIFAGETFEIVDNYDWFKEMGYLQFLRDVGKHVPMRQMLAREFIQTRLGEHGSGISYAEFSYVLIQAYDFLYLHREHGVSLQLCGSDQWGNCIAGVDLIRRLTGNETHIWSSPLVLNKATGQKFGKTEDGAVWLSAEKTSVYQFYQFWLNVDDEGVVDYLKIYTLLPKEEIEHILSEFENDRAGRLAQKTLAYEVTKLVHGQARADEVKHATEVLFGQGDVTEADLEVLKHELPVVHNAEHLAASLVVAGLASSNTEASRFLGEGAVAINGQKATPETQLRPGLNVVKRGKNSFAIIEQR